MPAVLSERYLLSDVFIESGKSPYWYAKFRAAKGKWSGWLSTGCTKKEDADAWARRKAAERAAEAAGETARAVTTLKDAYGRLLDHMERKNKGRGVSESTYEVLETKSEHVLLFFGDERDIATIKLNDPALGGTEQYLDHRRRLGIADATIAKEIGYLMGALRRCFQLGLYMGDYARLWPETLDRKFPGRTRWLPWEEYLRLFDELQQTTHYERKQRHGAGRKGGVQTRAQTIWHEEKLGQDWSDHLAMYCFFGLRFRDIYKLCVEHVRGTHLQIPGTKTVGAKRQVPIAPEVAPIIERRVRDAGPDGLLFPLTSKTAKGTDSALLANQKRAWLRALKRACKALGIAHTSTNDLRRTFATWAWQGGVPEEVCIRWMGHASAKMIREVYAQPSQEQGMREIGKLPSRSTPMAPMTPLEPFAIAPRVPSPAVLN